MSIKQTALYFTNDKSDKEYHASIEESGDLYVVNFAYGGRGKSLKTGTKTQAPVPLEKAETIYNKLVLSKTKKGYTEQEDGSVYTSQALVEKHSGIDCQLLDEVDELEFLSLLNNDHYFAQRKFDGVRLLIECKNNVITGINRKGFYVNLSVKIVESIQNMLKANQIEDAIFDGEGLGDTYGIFDVLSVNGNDLKRKGAGFRVKVLTDLIITAADAKSDISALILGSAMITKEEKNALYHTAINENWEGIVLKEINSTYQSGHGNGNQFKFKLYETASVIVIKINEKRSVQMGLLNDQQEIQEVGNVTIPPNKTIPDKNDILEVRYLYSMPKTNRLYQPTFLMNRLDEIDLSDCALSQLKYKAA